MPVPNTAIGASSGTGRSNRTQGGLPTSHTHLKRSAHHRDHVGEPPPIRLLLIEAQRLFRQSLQRLLEQEQDVTAVIEASTGHEADELAIEHQPNIVLLDVDMPDLNIESLTKRLHQHVPNTHILLLARYDEDARIVSAIQAGAFGYILKDSDWTDFLRILRATVRGEHLLSPPPLNSVVHTVPGAMKQPHEEHITRLSNLTDRERDILVCAADGRSNKEIADHLCLSVETVKTHLHHIYQKLSVDGRVSAILTYLQTQ